jgi:hypothetical protein
MLPVIKADRRRQAATRATDVSRGEFLERENSSDAGRAIHARPAALLAFACLPVLAGCQYLDKARAASDAAVAVSEYYKVEALVQADIERKRVRRARCYNPMLTPATISAAAVDSRLGSGWIDELLADCPQFAAFLSELTFRRELSAGLLAARDRSAPQTMMTNDSAAEPQAARSAVEAHASKGDVPPVP